MSNVPERLAERAQAFERRELAKKADLPDDAFDRFPAGAVGRLVELVEMLITFHHLSDREKERLIEVMEHIKYPTPEEHGRAAVKKLQDGASLTKGDLAALVEHFKLPAKKEAAA